MEGIIKRTINFICQYKILQSEIADIEMMLDELNNIDNLQLTAIQIREKLSETYRVVSTTEEKAISLADSKIYLEFEKKHCETQLNRIDNAINCLNTLERKIVTAKYIENERWYDVAYRVKIGERNCRIISNKALLKMARILNIK